MNDFVGCNNYYNCQNIQDSQYIVNSGDVDSSSFVHSSTGVSHSTDVLKSDDVTNSLQVFESQFVYSSEKIFGSTSIENSHNVLISKGIYNSRNIYACTNVITSGELRFCEDITASSFCVDSKRLKNCLFCNELNNKEYHIFNKPIDKERFEIILKQYQRIMGELKLHYMREPWPESMLIPSLPKPFSYFNKHYLQLPDKFWRWVQTVPGYDADLLYKMTLNPDLL